ncbi:unnamed protein product [Chrysoparadoxa australica]
MQNESQKTNYSQYLQECVALVGGVVAPIVVVFLLTHSGEDAGHAAPVINVTENIQPLAQVAVAPAPGTVPEKSGEEVFAQACAACHTTGAMNAPMLGDAAAWKPRVAQGLDTLIYNAINGLRMMPARGGNPDLTDNEIAGAIVHMTNQSGADFSLPK